MTNYLPQARSINSGIFGNMNDWIFALQFFFFFPLPSPNLKAIINYESLHRGLAEKEIRQKRVTTWLIFAEFFLSNCNNKFVIPSWSVKHVNGHSRTRPASGREYTWWMGVRVSHIPVVWRSDRHNKRPLPIRPIQTDSAAHLLLAAGIADIAPS